MNFFFLPSLCYERLNFVNMTGLFHCFFFVGSIDQLYDEKIEFAAIGLINMYNSGGAADAIEIVKGRSSHLGIRIKGRGAGIFGAYSNPKPKFCSVNQKAEKFEYRSQDHLLTIIIPSGTSLWDVQVYY